MMLESIIRNPIRFRSLLVLVLVALCFHSTYAQGREPQNIYRVRVQSRYVLEDGERTRQFFAINQEFRDSLNRLHTEIDYNWETRYPDHYRWHYFDGLIKTKTEHYAHEKLTRIEEFGRDAQGRVTEWRIVNVSPGDTSLQLRIEYSLNPDGTIAEAQGFNPDGRRGYRASYTYDENGTEIARRVRGRRAVPPDSIMRLACEPQYDSLGRMVYKKVTITKANRSVTTTQTAFEYDNRGNMIEERISDANGNLQERRAYNYRRDNRVQRLERFDGDGTLIEYLAWRYEIYRTSNRRHRELE